MSFTTGSSPDCSDSHLSLTPQFCVPACTPCVSDTEAELYCLVCQNYLCKQCYLYHDINDYLNLHRVVFICEIANLDELIHLMSDPDVVLNLTIFNSDWIYKNMLKKQITENKQALERMLAMSDFLRKQLHVLENHRCESMRLICSSHRQFETYLRSQKDQIVTSLQNEYDGVKMSILTKAQTVDQTVRDLVVKLNKMQLMTENNGETASGIDMEMAARHGLLLNGDCMDNNVFFNDFASYLPDDFHSNGTDSSDATDRHVIPSEFPNLPVLALEPPKSKCHVNPDLSLSSSNPDDNILLPSHDNNVVNSMQLCKTFGQKGNGSGQFNSPHGFCIGFNEDIVVADSSNHRVQIFDKYGRYKSQFGITGRHDGYLWHPRKVVWLQKKCCYVVCDRGYERSRMQVFTKEGKFYKKINVHFIDIVAGIAVTSNGEIVVVDSVTPTLFIADENDFLRTLDCSPFIQEPSDIAVVGKEFYICDFKGHAIVVMDDDGNFLRKFGGTETTMFPNGIDISSTGDVIVGDSHGNYFHVAVYSKQGNFLAQYRCPVVKVSRCCGLKMTSEGRLVTVDKNYHHVIVFESLFGPPEAFS
ncbi:uncharacterized protein LOC103312546 [Tribolium castaneum]|uniref:uncharacterized protein LOC103312546 n=1 Tax=Tribolium castaneum TaxID=7070 RepID=UPI0030FE1E9F